MFTGLIQAQGTVESVTAGSGKTEFCIHAPFENYVLGESIAVHGACLSVTKFSSQRFWVDASAETLARTTLGLFRVGQKVHLERALAAGDRLGGHIVSGHVDGVGHLVRKSPLGEAWELEFHAGTELSRFVAKKGSICVDGVSLTTNEVTRETFTVAVIPITLKHTQLGALSISDRVNLEIDVVARYVARWLETGAAASPAASTSALDEAFLAKHGFVR